MTIDPHSLTDAAGAGSANIDRTAAEGALPGEVDVYALPRAEVRRRSLAGIFYLTSSNVANLLIGFFSSLVLARLLTPRDFGVVAVGSTLALLAGAVADGGLGAGVWGLATGAVVRATVQTALILALSIGFQAPSLRGWRTYGPLLRFGLKFQASYYAFVAREQAINIAVGLVGGVTPL